MTILWSPILCHERFSRSPNLRSQGWKKERRWSSETTTPCVQKATTKFTDSEPGLPLIRIPISAGRPGACVHDNPAPPVRFPFDLAPSSRLRREGFQLAETSVD